MDEMALNEIIFDFLRSNIPKDCVCAVIEGEGELLVVLNNDEQLLIKIENIKK